ncbi:MAG: nuclear transport factor 2 family protein [Geitlerinemataceae cyanobacterium]
MSSGGTFRQWTIAAMSRVAIVALGLTGALVLPLGARADSPDSAPPEVLAAIERLARAANNRDLPALMDAYDSRFAHDDGFDRAALREATEDFWARYETLTYDIELLGWEATPNGYVTETEVTIAGTTDELRAFQLQSALRSRQTFSGDRIVRQTTLEEVSVLTAGSGAPDVRVQIPDGVAPSERFDFDAIVVEPLGDSFLLGGALDETVDGLPALGASTIELRPLMAGGLFKTGTAPDNDLWLSGALVREDGITIVTHRLPVAPRQASDGH